MSAGAGDRTSLCGSNIPNIEKRNSMSDCWIEDTASALERLAESDTTPSVYTCTKETSGHFTGKGKDNP